jgi:hypothetical protein
MNFKEVAEVLRHRPEVGEDENSILLCGERQDLGGRYSLQLSLARREKVHLWLATETPADDCVAETGIRQEADHSSALPR